MDEAIHCHDDTITLHYRIQHSDGRYFWREDHTRFHYALGGACITAYVIARDITERRLAEARDFELALEKERIHLLMRFAEVAAHEFRTPLTIIGTAAYMLTRLDDAEARQRKGEVIDGQLKRITTLVDMMLTLVRLETSDPATLRSVKLNELLAQQQRRCIAQYGDRPVLRVEAPTDLPSVLGNDAFLGQALRELLDNAYRFTPAEGQIALMAGTLNDQVWVEVADTGMGITADELPHIFETFWRRDQTHTTAGFGLGLSIVQRVVQLHGGTIAVESQPGQGARFRITLPLIIRME
ncbi:MAG: hypothetical protein IPK19_28735 [Chloroflexi bacterium]|nr:hypothetical protein [Chloroflexota bacterium]